RDSARTPGGCQRTGSIDGLAIGRVWAYRPLSNVRTPQIAAALDLIASLYYLPALGEIPVNHVQSGFL
ncbi:hypothetical protein, partial [Mycobacteroides abscessus]